MTDTFLDDHTTKTLAGDLTVIAASSTELLRIARREVSPPGGKAARNPRVAGSRPPLNIGALSVSNEVHTCLAGWARNLKADTGLPMPSQMDDTGLAMHLKYHIHRVAQQNWAYDCADEIARWARSIQLITTAREREYIGPCQSEGPPQCRGLFTGDGRNGDCNTCGIQFDPRALKASTLERIDDGIRERLFTANEVIKIADDRHGITIKRHHIDDMQRRKTNPLEPRGTDRNGVNLFLFQDVLDRTRTRRKMA